MLDLARKRKRIGKIEDQILENTKLMGEGIESVNQNKAELQRIEKS